MWTRKLSTNMAMDYGEFCKGLTSALKDPSVIQALTGIFSDMRKEVSELTGLVSSLRLEVADKQQKINSLNTRVEELEASVDTLEQYSRRNSLRISGVPEEPYEDTGEVFLKLINSRTQIHPALTINEIDRIHRVGAKKTDKPSSRQIIVKFATYRSRQRVYKHRKELSTKTNSAEAPDINGSESVPQLSQESPTSDADIPESSDADVPESTASNAWADGSETWGEGEQQVTTTNPKVYINEDLTRTRANILYQARKLKKAKKILDCWSHDGNILIKNSKGTIIHIPDTNKLNQEATSM